LIHDVKLKIKFFLYINQGNEDINALLELKEIVLTSDISPFEVNHSGLIKSLTVYLTEVTLGFDHRSDRLRKFLHVFAGYPVSVTNIK